MRRFLPTPTPVLRSGVLSVCSRPSGRAREMRARTESSASRSTGRWRSEPCRCASAVAARTTQGRRTQTTRATPESSPQPTSAAWTESNPVPWARSRDTFTAPGRLAQLGERRLDKAEVAGSSPASSTSVSLLVRAWLSAAKLQRRFARPDPSRRQAMIARFAPRTVVPRHGRHVGDQRRRCILRRKRRGYAHRDLRWDGPDRCVPARTSGAFIEGRVRPRRSPRPGDGRAARSFRCRLVHGRSLPLSRSLPPDRASSTAYDRDSDPRGIA